MKKTFLFSSILATTLTLSAATYANNHSAQTLDSLFLKPSSDDMILTTSYTDYEYSTQNTKTTSSSITQIFNYGVTDRLSAKLSLTHEDEKEKSSSSTLKSDGFNNPEIELKFRTANKKSDGFFSDITFSIAPDIITAKDATSTDNGTVANGQNAYAIAVDYGRNFDMLSYKLTAKSAYNAKGQSKNATTEISSELQSSSDFSLIFDAQYKLNALISIDVSASRMLVDNISELKTAINYNIHKNSLLTLSYAQQDDRVTNDIHTAILALKYRF
ncbi:MAG: hypothetical protein HON42_04230 [Alphaproteobacteria bacterium]|jgi:hypothetical protein|nr:hypothetical protein [Alphaproteobacteria bacterium]MBT5827557.1 hypothetical protein [Alphaproteobacteria bacterium]